MAHNNLVDNRRSRDQQNNILKESQAKKPDSQLQKKGSDSSDSSSEGESNEPECAVCLQPCIHPVQLPCTHIFCFLCVKGVANQSKRCALCRTEIPLDYLNNPRLLRKEDLLQSEPLEDGFQWYYEGNNGWWQYDARTTQELEDRYKKGVKAFEILIAGFLYIVDMDSMIQFRRNDPTRRRRIKRDVDDIPNKKGVAGLKVSRPEPVAISDSGANEEREGSGDGVEEEEEQTNTASLPNVTLVTGSDSPPRAPTNTPQSPQDGSPGEPSTPTDLTTHMANLSLSTTRGAHASQQRSVDQPGFVRQNMLESPQSSSSDSDWD